MRPSELLSDLDKRLQELEINQATFIAEQKAFNQQLMERVVNIHAQTTMTNGRVTKIEHWKSKMGGVWTAVAIGSTVLTFAAGIIMWLIDKQ
jgi:hypothetical protein